MGFVQPARWVEEKEEEVYTRERGREILHQAALSA